MARVLVTGGSGFLGSLLVPRLLAEGHDVTSIDLLPSEERHASFVGVVGDIRDRALLDTLMGPVRPDVVFHCAALLAHGRLPAAEIWSANADGTRVLAAACAAAGVEQVVYLSSNCLWATGFDRPVREEDPPEPVETYGASKLEGELILQSCTAFGTTVMRCPTIIDEGRLGLLAILFEFISEGRTVWLVGSGENRYQFIYAGDLIEAMLRAWTRRAFGVFGIGSDQVPTMRETFADLILKAGSSSRLRSSPLRPAILAMKAAHHLRISPLGPYHYRMIASDFIFDTSRIKAKLDSRPTLGNGEMLLRAYRYFETQRAQISGRHSASAHRKPADMGAIRILKWVS